MVWSWATEYGDPGRKSSGVRRADGDGGNPLHQRVLELQATAGNGAVQQMLQREPRTGGDAGTTGDVGTTGDEKKPAKREIVGYGSRGESVKRLQEALNQYGAGTELTVDGIFGPLTREAVREFQTNHPPLDVDGKAGPETWAELERVGNEGAPLPGATAKDFFEKGKKLYGKGRYALAYDEFAKAYQLDPDRAYLFNMAQAMRLAGARRDEAIRLFEQFIGTDPGEEAVATAKEHIAELRGPSPTADQAKNKAAADEINVLARKLFGDGEYSRAYDEFTKAFALTQDPAYLFNRASSLRAMGGQRGQAIALFQQFLTTDVAEDKKAAARQEIVELRGPGPSGDEQKDRTAQQDMFLDAKTAYVAEDYALAYDLFSKAWEIARDPAFLWNRAQSLRLMGGRSEEAIKLYQQFLALDLPDEIKKSARVHIAELKGPGKAGAGAGRPN